MWRAAGAGLLILGALGVRALRNSHKKVTVKVREPLAARRLHVLVAAPYAFPGDADALATTRAIVDAAVDRDFHIVQTLTESSLRSDPWPAVTACVVLLAPKQTTKPEPLGAALVEKLDAFLASGKYYYFETYFMKRARLRKHSRDFC